MSLRERTRTAGLGTRLLVSQGMVVLVVLATILIVTEVVGLALFREHMVMAGHENPDEEATHVEEAFRSAITLALVLALGAALVAALVASLYLTRRVAHLVQGVAEAASTIAAGDYGARVRPPALGPEFEVLADSFNQMARRLADVETTRRQMLGDLAHEMRTPIATLDAYLESTQTGVTALDPPTVDMLRGQTQRLARLAEDISTVSRIEEHHLNLACEPVQLPGLIEQALTAHEAAYAAKGVRLATVVEQPLPTVSADPDRLGQVMTNLLNNALRHTPAGGRVTLEARSTGERVVVTLSDSGDGIPAQALDHVLERFYRVDTARDRQRGGSGVGLTIAHGIIRAHGGNLTITSPGRGFGTTVTWWLPNP
ncbi:HAMP domain-containing histidine kinase [Ornithinimicrobium ciconiae]|uniref:histidine kinase n=1 Tax=Ornithinimicrobium ciconiae TaxID=2594265 RepID=A0A516GEM0_9MICO|nr:HAMP domain-containing sensor histidine kinase [Ornithinimicrobium ciconiae]QDO89977.1 HAMP domain-containing histidine kinase [Ornithinimicrobium ciconiae]